MTITKTKIELTFKSDRESDNEYYHGKDFSNSNLKYLTPEKLPEIIKKIDFFKEDVRKVQVDNFSDSVDLVGEITKDEIENPTDNLISLYLKYISGILAFDTYPSIGLTVYKLQKVAPMLTRNELIELLNHIAYPYFEYGDYWVGITYLNVVETDFGNYFEWEVTYGDDDFEDKGITPFTTTDKTIDFTKFNTVKELKELLDTLPEDSALPKLSYKYNRY